MKRAALALIWLCGVATPLAAQRLPQTVLPSNYDIHLSPDLTKDNFQGEETISVRTVGPTSSITLHAAEIQFKSVSITSQGRTQVATVSLDANREMATFTVPDTLPEGRVDIHIEFVGQLNDKLRGFYLSKANGRKYAVTQLEATDARRAFPSFDEPAMKATFAISVTIDERDTAISNGSVLSDTPGPGHGKHTLKFSTTPKMSSYLVALAVGDFECIKGGSDGIPIRICATPDKKSQTGFALAAAEYILGFYNRYYAIKYPFEKLDIVAVPDFAAGAMENTGAIFYRERLLLIDDQAASVDTRKQVVDVLGHEISHQWFGDLVTMQWWDDIWLNEGFATWMERKPMQAWKPEWNAPLDDARDTQGAMGIDALRSTRPIRTAVETPAEINQVFDGIAYEKTAAVLRMIEAYVGPEIYRNGVNAYLKKYAYGNATAEGFWTEMAAAANKPIDRILASFITQSGMPLIGVQTSCTGGNTNVRLTQQRLTLDPKMQATPPAQTWQVPVCFKRPKALDQVDGMTTCELLTQPTQTVTLSGCSPWVFANANGLGYYRTAYDRDSLRAIGAPARSGELTPVEQISLLEDEWALVRLGKDSISGFLSLSDDLLKGPLSPAVQTVTNRIEYVADHLVDDPERASFQTWVRQLLRPIAGTLGWTPLPDEPEDRRATRSAVLHTLGYAGRDPEVLKEARQRIEQYLDGAATPDPNMLGTIISLAAINGDARLYEKFLDRSKRSTYPGELYRFRNALAFFTDPALRKRTLDYALSPDIRSQDAPSFIAALIQNPSSQHPAWEYVKANWAAIEQSLGIFQGIPPIIKAAGSFCDQEARDDIRLFFDAHPVAGVERTLRQALEGIDNCMTLKAQQATNLATFLRQISANGH